MVLNIGSDYIFSVAWSEGVGFQRVAELIDRVVRATTGVRIRMPDVCSRLKAKERLCAAWSAFCFREGARPEVEEVEVRRSNRSEMIDRLTRWYRGLNYAERQQCQALFFSLNGALSEMREFGGDIQEIQLIDREECMISSHAMITLLQEVIVPTQTLKSLYVQGFTPRTPRHWRDVAVHPAPLGDPFFDGLFRISSLCRVHLIERELVEIPPGISRLRQLGSLDISCNLLREIPDELCRVVSLRHLNVQDNRLVQLPLDLGNLTGLTTLLLGHNRLARVVSSARRWTSLIALNLSSNQFCNFPEEILSSTGLKQLDLSRNQLTVLPEAIGSLGDLERLALKTNQLARLPQMSSLTSLMLLSLQGNRFATIPEELMALKGCIVELSSSVNLRGTALLQFYPKVTRAIQNGEGVPWIDLFQQEDWEEAAVQDARRRSI